MSASDTGTVATDPLTLTRSDERVLAYLDSLGTEYPALIAGNTGLYVDHVDERLDLLASAGLVERVTGESVYRITDAGRDALPAGRGSRSD